jgi:hypothetical protein
MWIVGPSHEVESAEIASGTEAFLEQWQSRIGGDEAKGEVFQVAGAGDGQDRGNKVG